MFVIVDWAKTPALFIKRFRFYNSVSWQVEVESDGSQQNVENVYSVY